MKRVYLFEREGHRVNLLKRGREIVCVRERERQFMCERVYVFDRGRESVCVREREREYMCKREGKRVYV